MPTPNDTSYTIDPDPSGNGYWVHSHGTYPESSVNAGMYRRIKCRPFATIEEAQAAYPTATVSDSPVLPMWVFRP